ncbi:UNVERIFIED_CONTAM: hypothetical protein Sangu_3064200 [Sesamum angustifolium]|uniref:Transmembrane protein n=1 Tax=Sesamum angustifolium TaxID=2727405 RepID=A0AAW2KFZ7_9LAMI
MGKSCFGKCRLGRIMGWLQIVLGALVIIVSISSLSRFYSAGFFLHNEDICRQFYGSKVVYEGIDVMSLTARVEEVLRKMESLQDKLESAVQRMDKNKEELHKPTSQNRSTRSSWRMR